MELHQLFYIQSQLDKKIAINHELHKRNLIPAKILALLVELGELANETRCFKYWSLKEPSPKEKILEEYVDCLHFILSIGLDKGFIIANIEMVEVEIDKTEVFQDIFAKIILFKHEESKENYLNLFKDFLSLGNILGFKPEDIFNAYITKNEINHQRQLEGY